MGSDPIAVHRGRHPDSSGEDVGGTVKMDRIYDLASKLRSVITGTDSFRISGRNLTVPDGDDESLGLYAKNGVDKVADIVVSETDGGQQITCHLSDAAAVPKGTYKVRIASHGLDPTDPLTVATLTVTLVEAIPEPSKPRVTIGSLAAVMEDTDNARITLDNLANFEAIRGYAENPGGTPTFTAKLYRNGTYLKDVTFNVYDPDIKGLSECETTGFTPDEELKVVLEVDPEKTEYDPTPAEATCTVTA